MPDILCESRRGVREVIAMTDGWYSPTKNAIASAGAISGMSEGWHPSGFHDGWHPSEPPGTGSISRDVTPTLWLTESMPYHASDDNLSAFYLRRIERPLPIQKVVRDASDPVLRVMAVVCVAVAGVVSAFAMWRFFV